MSTEHVIMWCGIVLIGFAGSALYSGLETGAYTLNRVRLHVLEHRGSRAARVLARLIAAPTVLLATLLIGNNLMNQLGTLGLARLLDACGLSPWETIILNTLIVTPLLFVFGETLPKDIFASHSDRLMYRLCPVLSWSKRVYTYLPPFLVPLIGGFSALVMWLIGSRDSGRKIPARRQIELLVQEGVGYGLITDDQTAIVGRVLDLADRRVSQQMTPWGKVTCVAVGDKPERLWELSESHRGTQIPVLGKKGTVVGTINLIEALLHRPHECPAIRELMQPVRTLHASTRLRDALHTLQSNHESIAIVVGKAGAPVGVVTIRDLVEPITGELAGW